MCEPIYIYCLLLYIFGNFYPRYWANRHGCKWPNIEKIVYQSGHTDCLTSLNNENDWFCSINLVQWVKFAEYHTDLSK